MRVVHFRYSGRFGHFLRAEANASWTSYRFPPRTALLGLLGAILGLEKDTPQSCLAEACIGSQGASPQTHWHGANIRKQLPNALPLEIKVGGSSGQSTPGKNASQQRQEWLLAPSYQLFVSLPAPYQEQLEALLQEGRSHYTPCMGLSEMLATLCYIGSDEATKLPQGRHDVACVVPLSEAEVVVSEVLSRQLALKYTQMPYGLTEGRVFSHASYAMEREGRPIPVETSAAWCYAGRPIMFL